MNQEEINARIINATTAMKGKLCSMIATNMDALSVELQGSIKGTEPNIPIPPVEQPLHKGMTVKWGDWFTNGLDTNKWRKEDSTYGDGNNELQAYHPDNVSVRNGHLVLRAHTEFEHRGRRHTSGMIRSIDPGMSFDAGEVLRFRYRIIPGANGNAGLWPALWSSSWASQGDRWPAKGEFDAMEQMTAENPERFSGTIHWAEPSGKKRNRNHHEFGFPLGQWVTVNVAYHRDANHGWFEWELNDDPDSRFIIEGPDKNEGGHPFMEAIDTGWKINLALGGRPGPLDEAAIPAEYHLDHVVIYK